MKFLSALTGFLIIGVFLIFALSNLQTVSVSLWPFDVKIGLPVFLLVLGSLAIGLITGSFLVWVQHIPHRRRARRLGKDMAALNDRLLEAEQELEKHRTAQPAPALPFLSQPRWRFWQRSK